MKWAVLAVAVYLAALICQTFGLSFRAKVDDLGDVIALFIGSAILAVLNITLGKVLKILTLPLSCLTLGLFTVVVNAIVLYIAAQAKFGFQFVGDGGRNALSAIVASVLIGALNGALLNLIPDDKSK
ncbi:MAG: phage holin family protein [Fimbriimonadaceae bacterium]|nr:phage holin family protein [Fimbriimonadaceae bacterium]